MSLPAIFTTKRYFKCKYPDSFQKESGKCSFCSSLNHEFYVGDTTFEGLYRRYELKACVGCYNNPKMIQRTGKDKIVRTTEDTARVEHFYT